MNLPKSDSTVVPIILAAGESRRMGSPKPLLDFAGSPCLEVVINICRRSHASGKPIVVLGDSAELVQKQCHLSGVTVAFNPHYTQGQTSSLQVGLASLPADADAFLIFPVDHVLVTVQDINRLIEEKSKCKEPSARIWIPTYQGKRGHPALFDRSLVEEFQQLQVDEPAHTVVRGNSARAREISVENPGVVQSMNTWEEYQRCKEQYCRKSSV